jgi:hypothetical protein
MNLKVTYKAGYFSWLDERISAYVRVRNDRQCSGAEEKNAFENK